MLHVCLILHATRSPNLGVGALTVAQVELLRGIARSLGVTLKVTILDWKDDGPACVYGPDIEVVRLTGRELLRPDGALAYMRAADIVLDIGAGDSFADIYGARRLLRIFWLKFLCHLSGTPLVLSPQTIGPFRTLVSSTLARASLKRSAIVCARDEASVRHLRRMGTSREILIASDVALRLHSEPVSLPGRRPKVGINVSGLLMSGGYRGRNDFRLRVSYPRLIRSLISRLSNHPEDPEIHLIGHVICPERSVEDDMAAIRQLSDEFPNVTCAPAFKTPSEAKGYIANMAFFTGARMHACIAAFSSGVAVVPMAYSRKFSGLFEALGYPYCADCTKEGEEEILTRIIAGFDQRASLQIDAQMGLQQGLLRLQAYDAALRALAERLLRAKEKPAARIGATGLKDRLSAR